MKSLFRIFAFSILVFSSCLQAWEFDGEAERILKEEIYSEEFSNSVIRYRFKNREYPIRLIYNPKGETLWGGELVEPTSEILIVIADLPLDVVHHLESTFRDLRFDDSNFYIEHRGYCGVSFDERGEIHPAYIAEKIDDSKCDAAIKRFMDSETFINKIFCYRLEGKYYQARILYNPEGTSFSSSKVISLESGSKPRNFTYTWSGKYGIFFDEVAPKALVDHLSSLLNLSWWDWYFNFWVENGTDVVYRTVSRGYNTTTTTTYPLDSFFNYAEGFR